MMSTYLEIEYYIIRLGIQNMYHVILQEEIASKCSKISEWYKGKTTFYKECYNDKDVIDLIDEYKKIEYLVDSDKYLQSAKEFNEIN